MENQYLIAIAVSDMNAIIGAAAPEFVTSKASVEKLKCHRLAGEWAKVFQDKINSYEETDLSYRGMRNIVTSQFTIRIYSNHISR